MKKIEVHKANEFVIVDDNEETQTNKMIKKKLMEQHVFTDVPIVLKDIIRRWDY